MSWNALYRKPLSQRFQHLSCGFVFVSFFLFFSVSGFSSWKIIARFNATINASFFFNEQRGFIGLDGNNGIKRTSDGGKTWKDCITPIGYSGFITDIFMKDSLNGWAGIEDDNFSRGLWYTVDGGVSWNVQANVIGTVSSVYQTPFAIIYGDRFSLNRLSVSINAGLNFTRISLDRFNGLDFVDDLHGVASTFSSPAANGAPGTAMYTVDGGLTWQKTTGVAIEAWGVYGQKGSSNFVIAGEKYAGDVVSGQAVYGSSDYGMNWDTIGFLGGRTTGHIDGASSVMYVQSWTRWQYPNTTAFQGMNRSTDGGKTWKNVGGPANYRDTRFSVVGCLGGVVYAFDETGGVWKTTDGGDGEIHEPTHNPNLFPDHLDLSASLCATSSAKLKYYNLTCNPLTIETVEFIDSTDPAVSSGALSFTKYPALPQVLDPTAADEFGFIWDPKKMGVQKPLSATYVRMHSTMLGGSLVFDTLFAINSQSFANQPVFSLSTSKVKFDSMNICRRSVDTTISFTNSSCDTLWLQNALLVGSTDWKLLDPISFTPLQLPIGVAPGGTTSFVVRFNPVDVGAETADLRLHFEHQGITKDTTLNFTAVSYRMFNVYGDDNLNFPPTSICTTRDTVIYLRNLNCDTLIVEGVTNNNSLVFSDISGITFPYKIPPDSSLAYRIRYNPVKNVTSFGLIVFQYNLAKYFAIWESTLRGKGLGGTSVFETSPALSEIVFPDKVACSTPDSIVFNIINTGCDSLTVQKSLLLGAALPAVSYRTEPPLPVILSKPGEKIRVFVYLQADVPTINDGSLIFNYLSSNGVTFDSSFTIHGVVSRGERVSVLSDQSLDLGTGSLCILRDTIISITNPGCPPITVKEISSTGNYFYIVNPRPTPFDLAPGETDTVRVAFDPTTSGSEVGQLKILTNTDRDSLHFVPLIASTKDIDHITFRLVQENKGLLAGDTAVMAFLPDRDWSGKALQSISFSITTNSDLLTYDHTKQANQTFQAIVSTVTLPGKKSQLNVKLSSPTEIILHKDEPLVYFYYPTTLTDTIITPVALSLLQINDDDTHYLNCILSPASQDGDFVLELECGGRIIMDFLKGKLPLSIGDAHPNPLTSSTNYQATLPFTASVPGTVLFECYDALGKRVSEEALEMSKAGDYSIHFDGSKISGGTYEYILKYKDNPSSSAKGRIVLIK